MEQSHPAETSCSICLLPKTAMITVRMCPLDLFTFSKRVLP